MTSRADRRRGFTIVEMLVVISVIVVLLAVLLPSLSAVRQSGTKTLSTSRLKQIGQWMTLYSGDNREHILPSQFDYSGVQFTFKGKVRAFTAGAPALGAPHQGTWADILWTQHEVGVWANEFQNGVTTSDYSTDSPDAALYAAVGGFDNPLRAAERNSRDTGSVVGPALATPWGGGAAEAGEPGYFAANSFFDVRPDPNDPTDTGTWYTQGEIRRPDKSMYLVDSVAGETIGIRGDDQSFIDAFDTDLSGALDQTTLQVDFRYNGDCLMLMLDGHIESLAPWGTLDRLEDTGIRIRDLDRR